MSGLFELSTTGPLPKIDLPAEGVEKIVLGQRVVVTDGCLKGLAGKVCEIREGSLLVELGHGEQGCYVRLPLRIVRPG